MKKVTITLNEEAADWSRIEAAKNRISIQVLNEYYVIVTQKLKPGMTTVNARQDVRNLISCHPVTVDNSV